MNNLDQFIEQLLILLDDLPESLIEQTKEFYDSFILDAKDEGLDDDEILKKLGNPLHIANQIKLDYYLNNESSKRKRFAKVSKAVFGRKVVATGFAAFSAIVTFFVWMMFFLIEVASIVAAFAWLLLFLSQSVYYSLIPVISVLGQLGIAILGFSAMLLLSRFFHLFSTIFRQITIRLITGKKRAVFLKSNKSSRIRFVLLTLMFVVGLFSFVFTPTMTYASSIWLSTEAPLSMIQTDLFSSDDVDMISLELLNANVEVSYANVESIEVTYTKEPWLEYSVVLNEGVLYLIEETNHELPFMSFLARHPGMQTLTIVLPSDKQLDHLFITSIGSNIHLQDIDYNLTIDCDNSLIQFNTTAFYNYDIQTSHGEVIFNDNYLGEGYLLNQGSAISIQITGIFARIEGTVS